MSAEQCTVSVNDQLACPCPTFINPANTEAAASLGQLQDTWNAQGCGNLIDCPAVECEHPAWSVCEPTGGSGNTGSCTDQFATPS